MGIKKIKLSLICEGCNLVKEDIFVVECYMCPKKHSSQYKTATHKYCGTCFLKGHKHVAIKR